jgi:nuclear pore complex protein Nup155
MSEYLYCVYANVRLENQQVSKMPLTEFSNRMELPGKTWAIAEYLNNTSKLSDFGISELGAHLALPPRQFLVLGNNGLTSFVKQRPVDTLQQLLVENSSNLLMREKELTTFFQHYGRVEACAMCLEIVCFNSNENGEPANPLSVSAANVFFEYGGAPTLKESSYPSVANDLGRPLAQVETSYSGRHDGLALYLARVVRPAWKQKLFEVK